jgi:uncharacterized protein (DUF2336 family)
LPEHSVAFPSLPNLEGLADLARRTNVDIKPTLARVLTDLYVEKPTHTPEEEQRYSELMLNLLESVDEATRAVISRKLATYPAAPGSVIRRLARDVIAVADPVLRQAACLTSVDLLAIIDEFGASHAAAIAGRRAVRAAHDASNESSRVARADAPAGALDELFLAASSLERRLILMNMAAHAGDLTDPEPPEVGFDTLARLETSALQRKPDQFAEALARALAIPEAVAQEIVQEASGELIVVAAKALDMPSNIFLRVVLFLNPAIGQSVERVFDLSRLYEQITKASAQRLIASLRERSALRRTAAQHQPVLWDDETGRTRRSALARRGPASSVDTRSGERSEAPAPAPRQRTS